MIKAFIEEAIKANRRLYRLIKDEIAPEHFSTRGLGAGGDISKEIDLVAEEILLSHLKRFGKIVSEECGEIGEGAATIYIDPIDGSENFVSKIPYFGSSVALQENDAVKVGIISNFANGDIFVKDTTSFRVAKLEDLVFSEVEENRYATIGIFERGYRDSLYTKRLQKKGIKYRVPGAVALSLAYAHYVDFVLFEGEMREYDIKAGLFMCENLYKYQYNDLLIVSKNRGKFETLKRVVLED